MFINNFLSDNINKPSDPYSLNLLASKHFNPIKFSTNIKSYNRVFVIGANVVASNLFMMRCLDETYKADNRPSPERHSLMEWMAVDEKLEGTYISEWLDTAKRYVDKFPEIGGNYHSRDAHKHIEEVTDLLCQTNF